MDGDSCSSAHMDVAFGWLEWIAYKQFPWIVNKHILWNPLKELLIINIDIQAK